MSSSTTRLRFVTAFLSSRWIWLTVAALLVITALVAVTAPAERTLGGPNARLVYFHGALVWASLLTWFLAAGIGVLGFALRRPVLHRINRGLGRAALLWWLLYIPVSILAANATWANNSWNLTFLMEPRFVLAFRLAAIMLFAQAIQFFFDSVELASLANIVVVVLMVGLLGVTERVLHPPAPIRDTESLRIQMAFSSMTLLLLLAGFQLARLGWGKGKS